MDGDLNLVIKKTGESILPMFSCRNCSETLEAQTSSNTRRNMKGEAVDVSYFKNVRYKSTINGEDIRPPVIPAEYHGEVMILESMQRISIAANNQKIIALQRIPVPGSVLLHMLDGTELEAKTSQATITIDDPNDVVFVSYRPLMDVIIKDFSISHDEKKGTYKWCLKLEEV